jgi:hypothetical protein
MNIGVRVVSCLNTTAPCMSVFDHRACYVIIHQARSLSTNTGWSPSNNHHAHHLAPSGAASSKINEGYYMRALASYLSPRREVWHHHERTSVSILTARAVRGTIMRWDASVEISMRRRRRRLADSIRDPKSSSTWSYRGRAGVVLRLRIILSW